MYLSVFLSLYSRKWGGEDSLYRAYILHTFCKVLKLQEWWYLSVFECLSVTLFTKGGGETPCTGPQPSAQYRKLASSLLHRLTPPRACAKCTEIHTYASIEVTFSGRALYPKKMKNRCFYLVGCDHYNHSMFHC